MSVFANSIQTALNYYKGIIRKNMPADEAAIKIRELRLKRRQLQNAEDIILYRTAINVIGDIKTNIDNQKSSPTWHFGLSDFMQHLKDTLNQYHIENNKVVHTKQKASKAMLEAIQLGAMSNNNVTQEILRKFDTCLRIVAMHGDKEQHNMLHTALQKYIEKNSSVFNNLLHRFRRYIEEARENWANA